MTNVNDDGPGSLRAAMPGSASTIEFDPAFFSSPRTIELFSPLPQINRDLAILGPGADLLRVDGQLRPFDRSLIHIPSDNVVLLQGFTLTGGYRPGRSVIDGVSGIFSRAHLTLNAMNIAGNRGTGVFNQHGSLTVRQSSVIGNTSEGLLAIAGTGIFNQSGEATIINSTFAENWLGVFNQLGNLSIFNSTFANNTGYGVISDISDISDTPHPLFPVPGLTIESSIFADNGFSDLNADAITSISYSLVEHSLVAPVTGVGNVGGVDPLLGPLADNGGPTLTMLLQPGSPAINAGSNPFSLTEDQRGTQRVWGQAIDIGAVESIPEPAPIAFSTVMLIAVVASRKLHAPSPMIITMMGYHRRRK